MAQRVLIVDDEVNIRFVLSELLRREGYEATEASNGLEALEKVEESAFDLVIMDIRMPRMDGLTALKKMRELDPDILVLIITAHGNNATAIEAINNGAYDYFTKPFDLNEVRVVLRRAAERCSMLRQIKQARDSSASRYQFGSHIVGQSSQMQSVYEMIERVVDNDVSVLITGESGTGKELVASAIHNNSKRKDNPFIKVNTVAIPETLLESELFGHEKGAFTGAVAQKIGRVEAAHMGTLFLDEIGDMPLSMQGKLLRVLQERQIERVGSTKSVEVDFRIVCATHRDLAKCVEEGTFREDLYYRINVMPIYLPPLRDRTEDVALLLDHFIEYYNPRLGKQIKSVSQGALQKYFEYPWPGNIRELENVVQRTMLLAKGDVITVDDLPPVINAAKGTGRDPADGKPDTGKVNLPPDNPLSQLDLDRLLNPEEFATPLSEKLSLITEKTEKYLIESALKSTKGHRQETADRLGISRKSLHNKMVRYELFDE